MNLNHGEYGSKIVYDGIDLSDTFICNIDFPAFPHTDLITQNVPSRAGSYFSSRKISAREGTLALLLDVGSWDSAESFKAWRWVSRLLNMDEPKPLYIDEGRYINAIIYGDFDVKQQGTVGTVELSVYCPDPYFYGEEHTETLVAGNNDINIKGFEPVLATFDLTATSTTATVKDYPTGNFVTLATSSSAKFTIDMGKQLATLNGSAAPVYLESDFFVIPTGDRRLQLTNCKGSMTYRERFL